MTEPKKNPNLVGSDKDPIETPKAEDENEVTNSNVRDYPPPVVPRVEEERPEMNDKRPEMHDKRPEMNDKRPEMNDKRPEIYDKRPEIYDKRPEIYDKRPEMTWLTSPTAKVEPDTGLSNDAFIGSSSQAAKFLLASLTLLMGSAFFCMTISGKLLSYGSALALGAAVVGLFATHMWIPRSRPVAAVCLVMFGLALWLVRATAMKN